MSNERNLLIDALEEIKYLCTQLKRTRAATQDLIETIDKELANPDRVPLSDKEMNWKSAEQEKPKNYVLALYQPNGKYKRTVIVRWQEKFTEEANMDYWDNEFCDYCEESDCYFEPEGWFEQIASLNSEFTGSMLEEGSIKYWCELPEIINLSGLHCDN